MAFHKFPVLDPSSKQSSGKYGLTGRILVSIRNIQNKDIYQHYLSAFGAIYHPFYQNVQIWRVTNLIYIIICPHLVVSTGTKILEECIL